MFDILFRPFCWIKKIWDIFRSGGVHATGHKYIETKESGGAVIIQILKCDICGKYSIGWDVKK